MYAPVAHRASLSGLLLYHQFFTAENVYLLNSTFLQ